MNVPLFYFRGILMYKYNSRSFTVSVNFSWYNCVFLMHVLYLLRQQFLFLDVQPFLSSITFCLKAYVHTCYQYGRWYSTIYKLISSCSTWIINSSCKSSWSLDKVLLMNRFKYDGTTIPLANELSHSFVFDLFDSINNCFTSSF